MRMTSKFCPKCGKTETQANPLVNELCQTCFSKANPLLQKYKELKIIICPSCKSYLDKNKWHPKLNSEDKHNIRKIIKKLLPTKLKFSPGVKISSIEILPDLTKKLGNTMEVEVTLKGLVENTTSKETHAFPVKLESSLCNLCKKRTSSYFEATIQIRPKNEKLFNFIKDDLKQNKKVFITKSEENKHGYDIYITSKEYLKNLVSKVKKKFEVETKTSSTLHGKREGRNLYRITLLLRLKE